MTTKIENACLLECTSRCCNVYVRLFLFFDQYGTGSTYRTGTARRGLFISVLNLLNAGALSSSIFNHLRIMASPTGTRLRKLAAAAVLVFGSSLVPQAASFSPSLHQMDWCNLNPAAFKPTSSDRLLGTKLYVSLGENINVKDLL